MRVSALTPKTPTSLLARVRRATWRGERIDWSGYFFITPFSAFFVLLKLGAMIFGLYLAFHNWEIVGPLEWVGLTNFEEVFGHALARRAFLNTFRYALIIVPGVIIVAFLSAVFVHRRWPGSTFARTGFFAPFVCAPTVVGLVWVWMLDTQFGLINFYLAKIGIPNIPWLTNPDWAWVGISVTSIWWDTGFSFILFLAALQDVPVELQESARIDGASRFQEVWHVVLPHLRPVTSMVLILQAIATLSIYSQVIIMTGGGPAGSTSSVIQYLYSYGLQRYRFGYAATVAVLLLGIKLFVTLLIRSRIREAD